ncbi:unnamed protein product, partial [Ectocarpus sp. 8 AP-2014]
VLAGHTVSRLLLASTVRYPLPIEKQRGLAQPPADLLVVQEVGPAGTSRFSPRGRRSTMSLSEQEGIHVPGMCDPLVTRPRPPLDQTAAVASVRRPRIHYRHSRGQAAGDPAILDAVAVGDQFLECSVVGTLRGGCRLL